MRAPTGLNLATFCAFAEPFMADYETEADAYFSVEQPRQYRPGGRHKVLLTRPKQNFFTLLYPKTYPTFDVLGATFSLPPSEACEYTRRLAKTVERWLLHVGRATGASHRLAGSNAGRFCRRAGTLARRHQTSLPPAHAAVDQPTDCPGKKSPSPVKTRSSPTPPGISITWGRLPAGRPTTIRC